MLLVLLLHADWFYNEFLLYIQNVHSFPHVSIGFRRCLIYLFWSSKAFQMFSWMINAFPGWCCSMLLQAAAAASSCCRQQTAEQAAGCCCRLLSRLLSRLLLQAAAAGCCCRLLLQAAEQAAAGCRLLLLVFWGPYDVGGVWVRAQRTFFVYFFVYFFIFSYIWAYGERLPRIWTKLGGNFSYKLPGASYTAQGP